MHILTRQILIITATAGESWLFHFLSSQYLLVCKHAVHFLINKLKKPKNYGVFIILTSSITITDSFWRNMHDGPKSVYLKSSTIKTNMQSVTTTVTLRFRDINRIILCKIYSNHNTLFHTIKAILSTGWFVLLLLLFWSCVLSYQQSEIEE